MCDPELLKLTDSNIGPTPIEETEGLKYREICRDAIEEWFGEGRHIRIESVELINGYRFLLRAKKRFRNLEQRHGGGLGTKKVDISSLDVWSVVDENKGGDFEVGIEGSAEKETCHACHGSKKCHQCGGTKLAACDDCDGTGRCANCGGSGRQRCPNCHGDGQVIRTRLVNCAHCHGKGQWYYNAIDPQYREWRTCSSCGGSGQIEEKYKGTCPTCGGDGRITCKVCGGRRSCGICNGTGKVECEACAGSGKCTECGATGKAEYSWWCVQKELSGSALAFLLDNDPELYLDDVKDYVKSAVEGRRNDPQTILSLDSGTDEASKRHFSVRFPKSDLEGEFWYSYKYLTGGVVDVFSCMRPIADEDLNAEIGCNQDSLNSIDAGKCFQEYTIHKLPVLVKCQFTLSGRKGVLFIDACYDKQDDDGNRLIRTGSVAEIERAVIDKKQQSKVRALDLHVAAALALSMVVIALPVYCGNFVLGVLLRTVFSQALIVGCALFLSIEYVVWYLVEYVVLLAERRRTSRLDSWDTRKIRGYRSRVWTPKEDGDWKERFVRLLWVLVPFAIVQMLDANVPQVSQVLQPAKEWFACISNTEWTYIAGICALKVGIIALARWRGWSYVVEKCAVVLLADLSLALLIWPTYLPDGLALKSISAQILSYVSLPVYCVGCAVFWPVWLALVVAGYVCRITGLLVWWIGSMLFWCISSFFS